MSQKGTPPLVPMWPQPQVRDVNQNPFPFFPFDPRWGDELRMAEFETFCALLRLAWVSPRPCFLAGDPVVLQQMLQFPAACGGAPINKAILALFFEHPETGLLYFPPQLHALERLVDGENIYGLLWDRHEKK